jgi:hypothetical protein
LEWEIRCPLASSALTLRRLRLSFPLVLTMLKVRNAVLIALLIVLAGCKIERHVTFDFANPVFDLHCGPVTLSAFPDSTVLHIGSTYFMLLLPFYVPLIFLVPFVGLWFILRRRQYAQPH